MLLLTLGLSVCCASSATADEEDGGAKTIPLPRPSTASATSKGTIRVPASVVRQVMQKRDVGATDALAADGSPLGARLVGVSKYHSGLRDGDVITSVGGAPTPSVSAVMAAGMRAAVSGATQLSGRIVRGGATYAVVLEIPK